MPLSFLLPFLPGLVSAGAGIANSVIGGNATQSAADAQSQAAQAALAEQQREFGINQTNQAPFIAAGQAAVGSQGDLLGLNGPDKQQAAITALQGSPGYQSLYHNGEQAVLSNASATGGLRGGNVQNSLANFGVNTLSQVIQQQLASLGGVAGQGTTTASNLGQQGTNVANSESGILQNQGAVQAGGILGGAAGAQGVNSSLSALLSSLFAPKPGGSGLQGGPITTTPYSVDPSQIVQPQNYVITPPPQFSF